MNCAICLGQPQLPETVPCCFKIFCADCLKTWTNIRNRCPLCVTPIGQEQKNQLKGNNSNDFDNGSLMLQNQLAAIFQRVCFLNAQIQQKRRNTNNYKSSFPKAHLKFIQEQMADIEHTLQFASLAMSQNNRQGATQSIQIITQKIYKIEGVLSRQYSIQQYESSEQQFEENYEEDVDYEELEQNYRCKPKKKNQKVQKNNI